MSKNTRHKCNNCGSKKNVRFYKKLGQYLCDRCGSYKVRDMEAVENDFFDNESLLKWEE